MPETGGEMETKYAVFQGSAVALVLPGPAGALSWNRVGKVTEYRAHREAGFLSWGL